MSNYKVTSIDILQHSEHQDNGKSIITLTVELNNNTDQNGALMLFDVEDFKTVIDGCSGLQGTPRLKLMLKRNKQILNFFRVDSSLSLCIDFNSLFDTHLGGDHSVFTGEKEVIIKFRYINRNKNGEIIKGSKPIDDLKLSCIFSISEKPDEIF